jgi:cytidyltransferase-like protein
MGQMWYDLNNLVNFFRDIRREHRFRLVCASGGFDPLHTGHCRHLQAAETLGDCLVVILNSDQWLVRKKGYALMCVAERMEVVSSLQGVAHVTWYDDGTPSVAGALLQLAPDVFAKGGDRRGPADMHPDELEVCKQLGCRIEYGVGGTDKVQSSSRLLERFRSTCPPVTGV